MGHQYSKRLYSVVLVITNDIQFSTPEIVESMENNLDIANKFCHSHGPSLHGLSSMYFSQLSDRQGVGEKEVMFVRLRLSEIHLEMSIIIPKSLS